MQPQLLGASEQLIITDIIVYLIATSCVLLDLCFSRRQHIPLTRKQGIELLLHALD